ncbi:MAG: SDR family oxidoreductase [Bacteroidales bacterium]|jgi:short-subunit dehydrogenase|nr:SDR family oxidoreductase [Bacteroidales bacterium]
MKIDGRTIIVTGSNNSIGQELVSILLSKECKVIAVDFKEPTLEETANLLMEKKDYLTMFTADVTDEKSVEQLYDKVIANYGTVDVIINNAGIIQPGQGLNNMEYNDIERIFNINYYGILNMAKTFLSHLLSRPEACLVISNGGLIPLSQQAYLKIPKIRSSIKMLTEGLHSELFDTNVKVITIFSGFAYAKNKQSEKDAYIALSPSKAAHAIINGMENDYSFVEIIKKPELNVLNPDYILAAIKKKIKTLQKLFSSDEKQNNLTSK